MFTLKKTGEALIDKNIKKVISFDITVQAMLKGIHDCQEQINTNTETIKTLQAENERVTEVQTRAFKLKDSLEKTLEEFKDPEKKREKEKK